jgi:hypothetical protein
VFSIDLPAGHFLIVGVDLLRVTGAVLHDAISIRAYRGSEGKLLSVAQTGRQLDGRILNALIPLSRSPIPAECRFIAFAGWPSIGNPYSLQAHLFAFDGHEFRTLWVSQEFRTPDPRSSIREIPGGFAIRRLNDEQGRVVDDRYIQTAAGVERAVEMESPQ